MVVLQALYHTVCIFSVLGLTGWCVHRYMKNEDATELSFKKLHNSEEDIYPSITLCFNRPFLENQLHKYDPGLTINTYKEFLSGKAKNKKWNVTYRDVKYDNVTITLEDFLADLSVLTTHHEFLWWDIINGSLVRNLSKMGDHLDMLQHEHKAIFYVSGRFSSKKCFTIDVPFVHDRPIYSAQIRINGSVFPHGIRPSKRELRAYIGYPNQFLRATKVGYIRVVSDIPKTSCYGLFIHCGTLEVLQRRNKVGEPCNEKINQHDALTLKDCMSKVGCNPKHWKMESALPNCFNSKQYSEIEAEVRKSNEVQPPCRAIVKAVADPKEYDLKNEKCDNLVTIRVYFTFDVYKEIKLVRSFTFEGLIGNAGKFLSDFISCRLICNYIFLQAKVN